ncbi:MAG: spore maturation protein [Lachnospiraceae bacterium]|nr:spore maturation protein [Lachnospiraceae bacterium]
MVNVLSNISNIIIPLVIFYIVAYGLAAKTEVYDDFVKGAKEGVMTVFQIMPTLVGLMVGVGVLRASGFLDFLGKLLAGITEQMGLCPDLVPIMIIKMFSSSAATGLVLDIFKTYGPDSVTGMITSIMMSCTETVFYTMSVYYMAAKVTKTRWTLKGALISTFTGVIASVVLGKMM